MSQTGYTKAVMDIQKNADLRNHSTMRLGGKAAYVAEIHDKQELVDAIEWAAQKQLGCCMIGSGSNIIWKDEGYPGLLLVNQIGGYDLKPHDDTNYFCTVGAGEIWDEVVEQTVQAGLSGIEALSLIPGTAGATPVQNVGAYGQELVDTLVSVEVYDLQTKSFTTIPASDCALGYRTSRFKTTDKNRFFITSITLHLTKSTLRPPFYASLQSYLDEHHITTYTPQTVRDAVIAIRQAKLPNPKYTANNGSFFANPIVDAGRLARFLAEFPDAPHWELANGTSKLSAAWLVEHAGFKNFHDTETGMATWPVQALVLVNEHAKTTADLLAFRQKILDAVKIKFNITLEQEPELLP